MSTGTSGLPPEQIEPISDQYDEIRYGQSKSGNVPAGGRDDYADRASLPRLPESVNGIEHIATAHDAAKRRWFPRRNSGISEYDPALPGTPPPGFRQTMAPVSDPRVRMSRNPRSRRPVSHLIYSQFIVCLPISSPSGYGSIHLVIDCGTGVHVATRLLMRERRSTGRLRRDATLPSPGRATRRRRDASNGTPTSP